MILDGSAVKLVGLCCQFATFDPNNTIGGIEMKLLPSKKGTPEIHGEYCANAVIKSRCKIDAAREGK